MKHLLKFSNYQLLDLLPKVLIICITTFAVQIFTFFTQTISADKRLEDMISSSQWNIIFIISYLLILFVIALNLHNRYMANKNIYTIISLPISRASILAGFIISSVVSVLILGCTQYLSVFVCNQLMLSGYSPGTEIMHNTIYLAFARNSFLRIFFPMNFLEATRSLSLLLSPVVILLFSIFCSKSKKYQGGILTLVEIFLIYHLADDYETWAAAQYQFNKNNIGQQDSFYVILLCINAFLVFAAICISYVLIKKRAILIGGK